jgi:hypothetical protein
MSRKKYSREIRKLILNRVELAIQKADQIQDEENRLVQILFEIDQDRHYVYCGYKSLMGFCNHALRFTKTQSQRLTTLARRYEPTAYIPPKAHLFEQRQD